MATPVNRQRVGPLQIAALSVGLTVGYLAGDLLPEVVNALQADLGMSDSRAGSLTTALLLATALTGLVFARRVRLGRWAAIVGSAFAMGDAIGPIVFGFTNDLGGTGSLIGLVVISSIAVALLLGPATLTLDRRRKAGRSPGDPADVGADALGP